ncbi:DUF3596 domain-containing protein [Mariprofundus sp. EBB-1]|uniref:Arm DNA-binding domain-containing protein n=1 Tax=Mariprofundus sp. EBB-1 TaxID=2650971 RepID=UPI000EF1EA87|nr:DUF3596 domain-containing protein [Mariprofundus sp. EBB-1]RLL52182.1 DUF3596 domain-containing protein [Mariprofundus sp. EBB-1]
MSVRPRGKSIQIDFYYRNVRCLETLKLSPTKANIRYAENKLSIIKHEIATNSFEYRAHFPNSKTHSSMIFGNSLAGNMTVEMALQNYFNANKKGWKKSTEETNLQAIEGHLIQAFKDVRLIDINVGMIRQWMSSLSCSPKRINNILIPLRGMLKDAHADGLIEQNPMDRIRNYKTRSREPQPFSLEEQKKILNVLHDQTRNLIQFAFYTGLRTGELIALRWSDIDFDNNLVRVRRSISRKEESTTKTAAGERDVVLFEAALEALNGQKLFTYKLSNRIFHNPITKKEWASCDAIWRHWQAAFKKLDIQYREPYQTRHTYASSLLSAGEHPSWISRQMGHTDPSVLFKKYARWMPEMYPHAGDKIRAVWLQNGN